MKCKRLCAWLLSLVMMFSLLPVSAAAAGIPAEYAPIFKWAGGLSKRKINVELFFENESSPLGTTSSEGEGTICNINVPNGKEIYKSDASSGCSFAANKFTFWEVWDKSGDLKLYTRSTAGHTVTVKYVFADESGKTKGPIEKQVKYQDHEDFEIVQPNYNYTISVDGDAIYEVTGSTDSTRKLRVTGGAKNSVFTVTYTPKDNYIYIDKYFGNGGIFSKWDGKNIKLNGYEFVENNALPKKYVIENHKLAPAMENYRFLTVTNADNSTTVYDFSYAVVIPKTSESTSVKIKDVWYDRDAGEWYYSYDDPLGLFDKVPLRNVGGVNFCYNTVHSKDSEYHQFDQVVKTVPATCTEKGYTDYECKYCGKEGQREYVPSLGGHLWGVYEHDKNTKETGSQHYQVCKREGCNATSTPVGCKFDLPTTETGKHTCTVCGYSYTDEITPTETPVYVYFKTVHSKDGNVRVNDGDGVTYTAAGQRWAS